MVYIHVVEKQILWTKRFMDKLLVGTVKKTIQQVSMSKKWDSKPALDEHGKPLLNANGKTVLRKSYSVLQDDFFAAMRKAGYDDVERGVPFPVSWTVKMKKKQKETQDILSYHTQAAGCSDKARAKASGGRQPIEECGRTGL